MNPERPIFNAMEAINDRLDELRRALFIIPRGHPDYQAVHEEMRRLRIRHTQLMMTLRHNAMLRERGG